MYMGDLASIPNACSPSNAGDGPKTERQKEFHRTIRNTCCVNSLIYEILLQLFLLLQQALKPLAKISPLYFLPHLGLCYSFWAHLLLDILLTLLGILHLSLHCASQSLARECDFAPCCSVGVVF